MYFNVNFNVLFKLIKVHLMVTELYITSCVSIFFLFQPNLAYVDTVS